MAMDTKQLSRRKFLSGCTAMCLGSSSLLAALSRVQLAHAQVGPVSDYKALVCVFLFGGNDAYNMLIPADAENYSIYNSTRQNLAIPLDNLNLITATSQSTTDFGLNPQLANLQSLYNSGKLALLSNVGALIEPVSKNAYQAKTAQLPPQLFSHNDQQGFVQSLQSSSDRNGWAGRAADILADVNVNNRLSMNISLSGSNLWQSGASVVPYAINPAGVASLQHADRESTELRDQQRVQTYENILAQTQDHIFARAYASKQALSWDLAEEVGAALAIAPRITTVFPTENPLAASLQMTAQLLAARDTLNVGRQTFFIGIGDYDTHGDQLSRHATLMAQLDGALNAFYNATVEMGIADKVTTFTASDFGRTLTSNGDGTDHAWGSHQIIMGDAVRGGDIYGTMPSLALDSVDDIGEGRIIPTISMDQYGATLAKWFGVSASNYTEVFPNLSNFSSSDLGFMVT